MVRWILVAALAASPAMAQEAEKTSNAPPQRTRSVTVYGKEECPKPETENEVVVCARKDESERFRIPSELRNPPSQEAAAQSWANRAETMMEVNRVGLPDSCSPVGTGGQTGCNQQLLRQWYQQRKAQQQAEQFPRAGD
ncbi:hypothetical protein [Sphingomonas desiccabilis]|uniref:DUF4124 domain-containing protein n=1 Tax=Sphingomonas desiccabilis TaxID=429134 RepID=A0A4Q2IUG4_9SPHN|nr:hypothetical protein [Sphingomonas desiccabilis]MBB3911032.1 hypothetical protein [Sphingomonas desiccabilis]RXZ32150.1 hypothetical protein EO081_13335 [Sphingomonas desiccabilis]